LAVIVAGCGRTHYTPEIAGVVVTNEMQTDQSQHVQLADGTQLTIPDQQSSATRWKLVYGSAYPRSGYLLLTGIHPEAWIAGLGEGTGVSAGCFQIGGAGEEEFNGEGHTSYVLTDVGLRVPEAPNIDKGGWPTGERWETAGFCLNERGEVYKVSTAGLGG
jgi:hypothetical protein